jgi:lysophospholipase L1-like esterase
MQQIFLYGDSLSWGLIPETRRRLRFDERWPGVMGNRAQHRRPAGCVSSRTASTVARTVWDDPFKPGRKGIDGLAQRIESHSPLALVIVMLGSNDFQSMHPHNAWHSAQGLGALVNAIRQAPIEPDMPVAPILLVAPPPQQEPRGTIAPKFVGGDRKCIGHAAACREVGPTRLVVTFLMLEQWAEVSRSTGCISTPTSMHAWGLRWRKWWTGSCSKR